MATAGPGLQVRTADLRSDPAQVLITALDQEIQFRYAEPLEDYYFHLEAEEVIGRHGSFAVAWLDGEAVGCGAVRLLACNTAELKRMYVIPGARRTGVARAVLRFLEGEARSLGARRMVLETVLTPPDAVSLYRAEGYEEIPRFGRYVASDISYCMGRVL